MAHDKVIDLIVQDLRDFKKDTKADFEKVNQKMDLLLAFKWRVAGGMAVISIVVTAVCQLALALFKH